MTFSTSLPLAFATCCRFVVDRRLDVDGARCTPRPRRSCSCRRGCRARTSSPRGAIAITARAPWPPSAVSRVPSTGSTATSMCGGLPLPTRSPLKSMGASSFSPSPMMTVPSRSTVLSTDTHGIDGCLVDVLLVASSLMTRCRHGGSLGDTSQLESEVAIGLLAHAASTARMSASPWPPPAAKGGCADAPTTTAQRVDEGHPRCERR